MKIAIVKLSAMGDIIHAMVALQFIKKALPDSQIDWIVEESFKGILENNPHIDNLITVNLKSIKKNKKEIYSQYKIVDAIGKNNYDVVIDAQGLLKSALVSWIVGNRVVGSFIAGFDRDSIREKIASFFYDKKIYIPYDKNTIDRNVKVICEPLGIKVTKEDILAKEPFLFCNSQLKNPNTQFKIIFVVGASKPNKIYPKEKFLEIVQKLKEEVLVVWGNQEEYETALWLSEQSNFITLDEKGTLDDLKFKIQNSSLVIGGDTGPTHIAWGMNIPSITIFGNTPAYRNTYETPINTTIKSMSIVDSLKLDKSDFSINEIDSNEIVALARKLLK